jgi:type IV secretory pathway ATPase VirB11/archaellum biosynthesis ATPase
MSFEIIIPFLKPIEHLLSSTAISEIMVNPDGSVWIEEKGQIQRLSDVHFEDGALLTGLEVIANRFGKKLDADSPIPDSRRRGRAVYQEAPRHIRRGPTRYSQEQDRIRGPLSARFVDPKRASSLTL